MRRYPSGVAVATSRHDHQFHGMTVNSFTSVSIDPPCVTVTMSTGSRTHALVEDSGYFGISILSRQQVAIADRFAGKDPANEDDRFRGVKLFSLVSGVPLLLESLAQLDCKVVHRYPMERSTLYVGEVLASHLGEADMPLMYLNREYLIG
jgi:flavin reductase (DIM6/NTAB) family NADH-FMN oxidoreductase RutF